MMTINSDNYGIIPYTKTITHDSLGHTVYIIKTKFNNKNKELLEIAKKDPDYKYTYFLKHSN